MKQLRLIIVFALLAFSSNLKAQPFLVLSGDPLCNDVIVVAYVVDGSCTPIGKSLQITISAAGSPSTSYDLSQPTYWTPGTFPTVPFTIEYVSVKDICNLNYKFGGTCPSGRQNAVFLNTGINSCNIQNTSDCFEYADPCAPCGIGDIINVNLSTIGSDVYVHVY